MNTLDAIKARKSTRGVSDRQISDADLDAILFAGGQAAVGGADFESMKLIAVQNKDLIDAIDESAAKVRPGSHPLYNCPTLIVLASRKSILPYIEYSNAGCVIQNIMVAAADLGIDSVYLWMAMRGINDDPSLGERLGFPEGYTCLGAAALGYGSKEFPKLNADEQRIEVSYIR